MKSVWYACLKSVPGAGVVDCPIEMSYALADVLGAPFAVDPQGFADLDRTNWNGGDVKDGNGNNGVDNGRW